jgi:RNA polymerase sigma-70 factor (ECF subfamily)
MNLESIYREESGRVLATLIRLLGDFDLAEEATQEAFAIALEQWAKDGLPANPRAWLVSTGRHKAIDLLRRRSRFEAKQEELQRLAELPQGDSDDDYEPSAEAANEMPHTDDRLRLIFTCCHPALREEAQVALTLRTLCGLTTEEIAKAFLTPVPTMAQRLVRAKHKIRDARIPYRVPPAEEWNDRLAAVMLVVYLVFNEGYNTASGDGVVRHELCMEAIRLGRLLCELLPREPDAKALLALMLLHDSRRETRPDANGDILLLEEQDRSRWNQGQILEGLQLAEAALREAPPSPYSVQAAIAALHARAARAEETDWLQIAALYEILVRLQPSPVIELNRAAAVAMAEGAQAGLRLLDDIERRGQLRDYYLLPAARGDLLRRLGHWAESTDAYRKALGLAGNDAEKRFLSRRLKELETQSGVTQKS